MIKVAMIGAGSVVFCKNLTGDILSYPEFSDATLSYMDVDAERLEVSAAMGRKVATALGVSEDRPLYVGDLTAGPLGRRLEDNTPTGPWGHPILVAWGDQDEVIPPRLQQEFVDRLCALGEQVRSLEYRGYDHLRPLLPGSAFVPVIIDWTEARFGRAATHVDDCPR